MRCPPTIRGPRGAGAARLSEATAVAASAASAARDRCSACSDEKPAPEPSSVTSLGRSISESDCDCPMEGGTTGCLELEQKDLYLGMLKKDFSCGILSYRLRGELACL